MNLSEAAAMVVNMGDNEFALVLELADATNGAGESPVRLINTRNLNSDNPAVVAKTSLEVIRGLGLKNTTELTIRVIEEPGGEITEEELPDYVRSRAIDLRYDGGRVGARPFAEGGFNCVLSFEDSAAARAMTWTLVPEQATMPRTYHEAIRRGVSILKALKLPDRDFGQHTVYLDDGDTLVVDDDGPRSPRSSFGRGSARHRLPSTPVVTVLPARSGAGNGERPRHASPNAQPAIPAGDPLAQKVARVFVGYEETAALFFSEADAETGASFASPVSGIDPSISAANPPNAARAASPAIRHEMSTRGTCRTAGPCATISPSAA